MKLLLFIGFMAAMITLAFSRSGHWGKRQPKDMVVLTKHVVAFPRRGKIQSQTVSYDPMFMKYNITAIFVNDNFRNSSGADAIVLQGGVGKKYVNIRLTGQRSMGVNSTVKIYGKK